MTSVLLRMLAAGFLSVAAMTPLAQAQTPPADGIVPPVGQDCSRWPASQFDPTSGSCVCPNGMWWNLRGEACLPREHAAGEFCSTVWPASQPFFLSGGGYRCVCAPPMLWDAQATACRPPVAIGDQDCTIEWPGTLPVLSPSGTEHECRCPGGHRWNDDSRSCVPGAPVIRASRGFYDDEAAAAATAPPAPGEVVAPTLAAPPAPGAAAIPPTAVPNVGAKPTTALCESLLAEIRSRAASGDSAGGDALGMRAAVSGCDPAAISNAAKVPSAGR